MKIFLLGALGAALALALCAQAETVGAVDTAFKLIGRNHQVVVEVFDDPKVKGVSCYVSRARTGGIKGTLGLAEDTADAAVACRQVGEITLLEPLDKQEEGSPSALRSCSRRCASCAWPMPGATRWPTSSIATS